MPMQEQRLTGLKKRQQIESASRTMFLWVAVASVAISICVVASQFFFTKLTYNQRIIDAKLKAADILSKNIDNAKKLKTEVDGLVANQDLASVKTKQQDPNTKSVLDALPSKADPTAWASSLQQAILSRSSVVVENITVPADDLPASQNATTADTSKPQEQKFSITVSGSYDKIRTMLLDMERTIRPIKVISINLNGTDADMRATIEGVTYYQVTKTTNIKEQVVK